jgi:hypothetical protein
VDARRAAGRVDDRDEIVVLPIDCERRGVAAVAAGAAV